MKLVLAITGASGAIYPKLFLEHMKTHSGVELHVVASQNALRIFGDETGQDLREFWPGTLSTKSFDVPFVSGSAQLDAMVILPCSTGTLGRIANGVSDDNISRGADVFLKERRQLIICPRETPLSTIHLQNMLTLSQAGATILPTMPHYYFNPQNVEDVAMTVVNRVFDHLGVKERDQRRWCSS